MESESNFSNPILPNEKPKGNLTRAILLGLLTFAVTPLIALVVAIPSLLLQAVGIKIYGVEIIAAIFRLRELGGYFASIFILFLVIGLVGDFGTAIISWFINRSKKLATITFISALIFQIVAVAFVFPATLKKSQETMSAGIEREKSYEQYATIGDVSVEPQEPFKFSYGLSGQLTEALLFKKLVFTIPISVSHAGIYEIYVRYSSNSSFYANSNSSPSVRQPLDVGAHLVKIEFIAGEAPNLGYESPHSVQGNASIQLNYLASKKELIDSLKSDGTVDQKILQQFMKNEGLDQGVSPDSTVNKFVGQKEVQF